MQVKLSRWGNSLAIRIPAPIARKAALTEGDSLEIDSEGNGFHVSPVEPKLSLEDLVGAISTKNLHEECQWGEEPVGNEAW